MAQLNNTVHFIFHGFEREDNKLAARAYRSLQRSGFSLEVAFSAAPVHELQAGTSRSRKISLTHPPVTQRDLDKILSSVRDGLCIDIAQIQSEGGLLPEEEEVS